MGFFDKYAPEVVRTAQAADKADPRPVLAPSYAEPSLASKAQGYGMASWIVQFACAFFSLPLAFYARKVALEELGAIAAGRRSPAGRQKAIQGYWLGQAMIWVWLFTMALILIGTVIAVPIAILAN